MNCPKCTAATRVYDSRPCEHGIRRRRVCQDCGHRFATYEISAHDYELVREGLGKALPLIEKAAGALETLLKGG